MKHLSATALIAATLLAACAKEEAMTEVTVASFTAEELNAATGMPGEAIVAAAKAENRYVVFYRGDAVSDEQVAAAPARICANTQSNVFAAEDIAPLTPELGEGIKRLSVTCGG